MLREYLGPRLRLGAIVLLGSAAFWWWSRPSAPGAASDSVASHATASGSASAVLEESLAELLARRGLQIVDGGVWVPPARESSLNPLRRRAIFVSATQLGSDAGADAGGDIYRAEVRLAADGRALNLGSLHDLTRSSSSLEQLLVQVGQRSLWAVRVRGVVQGLLLLGAERDERELDEDAGWRRRLLVAMNQWMKTGQVAGVGQWSYTLMIPALRVTAALKEGAGGQQTVELDLLRGGGGADGKLALDTASGELLVGDGDEARQRPRTWAGTPLIHWLVDTVRGFSWVGPRPIALLEKWVFNARNAVSALAYKLGLSAEADLADELGVQVGAASTAIRIAAGGPAADSEWPPPKVPSRMRSPQPGEGEWFPFVPDWLQRHPDAPPGFYKTALRWPEERPALVVMVAMDLRQYQLEMVAGLSTPWSSTGNRGSGRIPRDPAVLGRTVAAFNGGFQTAHGPFGMMTDHEVVLEPWQKTATLARMDSGEVLLGTWNNSIDVPEAMHSFRQNMPPLLEDGVWNPTRRRHWGGTISDLDQVNTTRSAVGYRGDHTLIWAWSRQISARGIAEALMEAGCEYGIHLDMNPAHAGFGLLSIDGSELSPKGKVARFRTEAPSKAQAFDLSRFVQRNGKDFFYLTLRHRLSELLPAPPAGFEPWAGVTREDLPEGFLPALAFSRDLQAGELLVALDLARLTARLVPERAATAEAAPELTLALPEALLDLGPVDPLRPSGLQSAGRVLFRPVDSQSTLTVDDGGQLAVAPPVARGAAGHPEHGGYRQGCPLLVSGALSGKARALLLATAGARHHALGLDKRGRAFYLSSPGDANTLAKILSGLGVQDALLLPDGPGARVRLLRPTEGGLSATDPLTERATVISSGDGDSTRIYLQRRPPAPRVGRLRMPDVALSREELRRQRRVQARIVEKREALREISNARFREYIERVKARREARGE